MGWKFALTMATTDLNADPQSRPARIFARVAWTHSLPLSLLIFAVCLMHMLRNLTDLYFGLWALSAATAGLIVIRTPYHEKMRDIALVVLLGAYAYVAAVSLYWSQDYSEPLTGIARLVFIAPALVGMIYTLNVRTFPVYYMAWLTFGVLAALSLPAQYVTGAISWFAESSERAGTERFGSLAGSLTVYGNLVGALIFIALVRRGNFLLGAALTLIILVGAVSSLQKAALASAGIGLITAVIAARIRFSTIAGLVVSLLLAVGLFYVVADDYIRSVIEGYVQNVLGTGDASRASDASFLDSLTERVTYLPETAIRYFGFSSVPLGVGVFGGSGSLGYPQYPHTHNLVAETILVFGAVVGGAIILGLIFLCWRAGLMIVGLDRKRDHNDVIAAGVYLNLILPTVFAGALFYHPVSGSMFICSALYLTFSLVKRRGVRNGAGFPPARAQGLP